MTALEANVKALATRNPALAMRLSAMDDRVDAEGFRYPGVVQARNGAVVPRYGDGSTAHSLFDPEREAKGLVDSMVDAGFAVFAGIGGAYHVREFLSRNAENACLIAESGLPALGSLLRVIDLSDVIASDRVTVVADCTDPKEMNVLERIYIPSIHGNFTLTPLRSWQERNRVAWESLAKLVRDSLGRISSDYSVQAHFGRLWLRNFCANARLAEEMQAPMPRVGARRQAVIAAAGPSLEDALPDLRSRRESVTIFTTDTAWNTLADSGIVPDFFVSIDAQAVSSCHAMRSFEPGTVALIDICGNPALARRARECGTPVVFMAGGHPLARLASAYSPLPRIDTSSGTVTVAALDAARSLGFRDVALIGADFAYTGGKPYARGTYLDHAFGSVSSRVDTAESRYAGLMFRTDVVARTIGGRITYATETLDRYARAASEYVPSGLWREADFIPFPARRFFSAFRKELEDASRGHPNGHRAMTAVLPLAAWCGRSAGRNPRDASGDRIPRAVDRAIQLALDMIAGYTGQS
jgi:hypothetical protein